MSIAPDDPVMERIRAMFEASGKSLEQLGRDMGYENTARQSAWQFLRKTADPRMSMLRRFAKAMEVDVRELLEG